MPAKLDKCVEDVMAKGKTKSQAFAICVASTGLKPKTKTVKVEKADGVSDFLTVAIVTARKAIDEDAYSEDLAEVIRDFLDEEDFDIFIGQAETMKAAKKEGPGGHKPDGTGPHGRGNGPGKGKGDGSGLKADEEKAEWTTAFINDLPDAAFAVILKSGKKDKGGKTTPRSLRLLPHHTAAVTNGRDNKTVDLPHLRNALARVGQIRGSKKAKDQARKHLEAHAKELLKTDKKKKTQKNKEGVQTLIIKKDDEKRIAYGVVLKPEDRDSQGDIYDAEVIEDAAHEFLVDVAKGKAGLDWMHDTKVKKTRELVASSPLLSDQIIDGRFLLKGTWVIGVRYKTKKEWEAVKEGDIDGYSIDGTATVVDG